MGHANRFRQPHQHLLAQVPTSELTGIVTDTSGAAIAGAEVTLIGASTGARRQVTTNSAGIYIAPGLQPGVYTVRVSMPGFRTAVENAVHLQVNQTVRLNFALQVGEVTETIEVSAAAENLDADTTTVGAVIDTRRIEDLPLNGRNYLQLANLVPSGTIYGPGNFIAGARGGGARAQFTLNLSGQRFQFNRFTLDGIENTDPNFGTYLFLPSVDALLEFKVETGTYSAEPCPKCFTAATGSSSLSTMRDSASVSVRCCSPTCRRLNISPATSPDCRKLSTTPPRGC